MVAQMPSGRFGICAPGLSMLSMLADMRVGSGGNYNAVFMTDHQVPV